MIPYADLLYFGVLMYVAVAAIALGFAGRMSWRWVLGINVAMLVIQYASQSAMPSSAGVSKVWIVFAYALFQWALARVFLYRRRFSKSKGLVRAAVALTLLPMLIVKLIPAGPASTYLGFLGISYVTFRGLDVILCIQDRVITALPPGRYLAYLLFFPTVSSGPVDRYNRFAADFTRQRTRVEFLQDLDASVQRIFRGLLYKFVLAALIKVYWLDPAAATTGVFGVAAYMYAYAFYLFFDFAGYSAFAIGVGYLFGIHTPENFDRPFLATSIVDFWNRWHVTLSNWFRDHVYTRFVMAAMRHRWFSSKLVLSCVGFYVSFVLMGIWHGLALRYLVYGLYHATLMTLYTVVAERRGRHEGPRVAMPWNLGARLVTFHLVCFGLLIFSGRLG